MLIFQPQPSHDTEQQPETRRRSLDDADGDPRAQKPEERLERVHRKERVERQIRRRQQNRDRCQKLCEQAAAQLRSDAPGGIYHHSPSENRYQTGSEKRSTQCMTREPRDKRDQGRLVHIAPREMLAAGDVVKLVAEKSVMIDSRELDEQFAAGQSEKHHTRSNRSVTFNRAVTRNCGS